MHTHSDPGNPIVHDMSVPRAFDQFYEGKRLHAPKHAPRFNIPARKKVRRLPDLLQGPYIFIVASQRLRGLFETLEGANVQSIPAKVCYDSGESEAYHFIQVLNNVDGIDWTASDIDSEPEDRYDVICVRRLVVDPKALGDRCAIRLDGIPTELLVNQVFRDQAMKMKITGVDFVPAESFQLG